MYVHGIQMAINEYRLQSLTSKGTYYRKHIIAPVGKITA